jgi:hypothetical protein
MKITKHYLETLVEEILVEASIPSEGGNTTLYHFTQESPENAKEKIELDPEKFGKMGYSKKDLAVSAVPRTFFYVDPAEKETFFANKALYTAKIPTANIYNLEEDPDGVKAAVKAENYNILDMDQVLKKVSGWSQGAWGTEDQGKWIKGPGIADGMYYETPTFAVVVMFVPVEAYLAVEQPS